MKKSILFLIFTIVVGLTSKAQVQISGNFMKSKASYTVYEMQKDSTFKEVLSVNNKRGYSATIEPNTYYVFKFTNKDNKTKYMRFYSYQNANVEIDVEFKTTKNAFVVVKNNRPHVKRTNEPLLVTR